MTTHDVYDVAIIGTGPVGLFAAFYAGMRELNALVLEALPRPGGQLTALYPEKYIYDVGGHAAVLARDLVQELWKQGSQFGATFRFNEPVETLRQIEGGHNVLTTPEGEHQARTVVIAAGLGAFEPNRLSLPGAAEFEGRGLSYAVPSKEAFLGKRLLVVGGGDTALDWALELQQWARSVTLVHRLEHFEAHERSVLALQQSKAHVLVEHEVRAIDGDTSVREVTVLHNRTQAEHTLRVDEVLVCIGFRADMGRIESWGLDIDKRAIYVNACMQTNLPGVYAAGDITQPLDGPKLNLIANGFGQATVAVNMANKFIYPDARVFPGHSSQKKGMRYLPTPVGRLEEKPNHERPS